MRRAIGLVLLGLVVLAGAAVVYAYGRVTDLDVEAVTDDVWMLSGLGGNVGVLRSADGAVVVDTMTFRMQGQRIREAAERLTGGPVTAVLNTHYHVDHAHGNPAFPAGTRVVATERTLDYMLHFSGDYWQGDAAETLPNDLFRESHELRLGDKTVLARHVGRGHTGGDLVVLFVEDRVLHTGDLLFNGFYPNIDLEAGGSVEAWIGSLDRVLELDFERVIPGHGPVTDRAGIEAFRAFLVELWAVGRRAAEEGLDLGATLERARLSTAEGFDVIGVPLLFRLDHDFVVTRVWQEATGAVTAHEVSRARREEAE